MKKKRDRQKCPKQPKGGFEITEEHLRHLVEKMQTAAFAVRGTKRRR